MALKTKLLYSLCFEHIINTLEEYPPDTLALLPAEIRFSMLTSLPLVDVCHLEQTPFISRLDMDKVWDQLYKNRIDPRPFRSREEQNWKKRLLSKICDIILADKRPYGYFQVWTRSDKGCPWTGKETTEDRPISEHPADPVNYLVAMKQEEPAEKEHSEVVDEEESYWRRKYGPSWIAMERHEVTKQKGIIPPSATYRQACQSQLIIPKRYSHLFPSDNHFLSDATAINLLTKECKFYPQGLSILCSRFSTFLQSQSDVNILAGFFREVQSLHLVGDPDKQLAGRVIPGTIKQLEQIPETVLGLILSNPSPKLSALSLSISKGKDEIIPSVAPIFSSTFSGLKELHVLASGSVSPDLGQLIKITENQAHLESMTMSITEVTQIFGSFGPVVHNDPKVHHPLLISWAKLCFRKPSFAHLKFTVSLLPVEFLQSLVVSFLSIPCSRDQTLTIALNLDLDRKVTVPMSTPFAECSDISDTCTLHYKSLVFDTCSLPLSFFQWVFRFHPIKLKQFVINDYHVLDAGVFPSLAKQQTFDFESLKIKSMSLRQVTAVDYKALVRKPSLKYIHFDNCSNLNLSGLAQGLSQEAVVEKLLEISLFSTSPFRNKELYTADNAGLQAFFNSLFSLPQLPKFSLNLMVNFTPQQLKMMYSTWEKKGGVQLKTLNLRVPKASTDNANLHRMAVEVHLSDTPS